MPTTTDNSPNTGSRLLGSNQLQSSIDSLTTAVQSLTTAVQNQSSNTGGGGRVGASGGGNGSSGNAAWAAAAGTFAGLAAGGGANGGGSGFSTRGTFGGSSAGGSGGGLTGVVSSNLNGLTSSGQLSTQAALSAYGAQATLMSPAGTGTQAAERGLYGAALGTNVNTLNQVATSASDAVAGQGLISYYSGSPSGTNRMGLNMMAGAKSIGMLNPQLGYNQSAQLAAGLYNPQTSMAMTMAGYGTTPLTMGRPGSASFSSVMGGILSRWSGGQKVSNSTMNQWLSANGVGTQMLNAIGLNNPAYGNTLRAYNKLNNAGYSYQGAQNILTAASNGNQSAKNMATKAGLDVSTILQSQKAAQSYTNQRQGQMAPSYEDSYATATSAVDHFASALNQVTNGPLSKLSGLLGGSGSVLGGFGKMITSIGGGAATPNGSTGGGATSSASSSGVSSSAVKAVGSAKRELGVPYLWGGEAPGRGFDCSGLVQWAYAQAGVKLPRTSQQQWSSLQKKSVPLGSAREGDLIFQAGSDGTASSPGHVALMVSDNMLIQAPHTGADVSYAKYDPSQWQHAARPSGAGTMSGGTSGTASSSGLATASGAMGGYVEGGSMGSTDEISALASAMSGMAGSGGGTLGGNTSYGSGSGNAGGATSTGSAATGSPGNLTSNAKLGQTMAAKKGWTGLQWNDLYALWMRESGWRTYATNPQSGAFGIPQSLPANKMASAGADWRTNPATQIAWGMDYIAGRYKNPAGAWAHEQSSGWYARGTSNAAPGYAVVGDTGPGGTGAELVQFSGGEKVMPSSMTSGLLASAGMTTPGRGGSGVVVNLNFSSGALSVGGPIGSGSDVSNAAREVASQIGGYLAQDNMIKKLAAGASS